MNEGRVNSHGQGAEALVIGIMPMVDPGLVGDLAILIIFGSGDGGGDSILCTDGVEVGSDKGCPLLVIGALESGDTGDKGWVGRHFGEGVVLG